jgi:hypothetical protein
VGTLLLLTALVYERHLDTKTHVHKDFATARQQRQRQSPHSLSRIREGSVVVEREESASTPSPDTAKGEERFVERVDCRTLADEL